MRGPDTETVVAWSSDGRYVLYVARTNPGESGTPLGNYVYDSYIFDLETAAQVQVNLDSAGERFDFERQSLSGDGQVVIIETKVALVPEDDDGKLDVYASTFKRADAEP